MPIDVDSLLDRYDDGKLTRRELATRRRDRVLRCGDSTIDNPGYLAQVGLRP